MKTSLSLLLSLLLCLGLYFEAAAQYIQVLGIAQDAGYPQAACRKDCCQRVWKGAQVGAMVSCLAIVDSASQRYWLIDATPDFREQLHLMEGQGELAGIFLTHAHIGHYTGLMQLGREVMGAKEVPVYAMPRMQAFLENNGPWSQLVALRNIEIQPLAADSAVTLSSSLKVIPLQVPHRDEYSETVGFLIEGAERKVLYIPDIDKWKAWEHDIRKLIREVDVAFIDGSFFENGEIPGRDMSQIPHPFIEESMAYFQELSTANKSKIHFIHFNHSNPVLQKEGAAAREVRKKGYRLAEEGRAFPLGK